MSDVTAREGALSPLSVEMAEECGRLTAFVDGELSSADADQFRGHLRRCDQCCEGVVNAIWLSARLSELNIQMERDIIARAKLVVTGPWWRRAWIRVWWWLRRR